MTYVVEICFDRLGGRLELLVSAESESEAGIKAMDHFNQYFALKNDHNTPFVSLVTERPDIV